MTSLSSVDSREALLVRVDTRTSLRVDSFENVGERQAFAVSVNVFIEICDSKDHCRTLNLCLTRNDGHVVRVPEKHFSHGSVRRPHL